MSLSPFLERFCGKLTPMSGWNGSLGSGHCVCRRGFFQAGTRELLCYISLKGYKLLKRVASVVDGGVWKTAVTKLVGKR